MAIIYQNGIQYSGSGDPLIYDDMGGATSTTGGVHGLVPAPSAGDNEKFLSGDGSWKSIEESVTKTASGNPIEVSDSANAPLVKCVTQITGYQEGSGTPSPDNIRPIVAYTEGEIEVRGKNAVDISKLDSYDVTGGGVYRIGVPVSLKAGTYTLSRSGGSSILFITNVTDNYSYVEVNSYPYTFTLANDSNILVRIGGSSLSQWDTTDLQIEAGESATTYEPYVGTTHTTTYPSAIFRGSEDVVKGSVTQNMLKTTYTGTTNIGAYSSGATRIPIIYLSSGVNGDTDAITNQLENKLNFSNVVANPGSFCIVTGSGYAGIILHFNGYIGADWTTSDIQSILSNENLELVRTLPTPTTSSVTPTNLPVKSLSGYSHIESSTGDMEIEYIVGKYQPIVDLISESSSGGGVTQTILYTATAMTDTEINVDLTAYDEYIIYANDTLPSVQMPQGNSFLKSVFQYVLSMSNPNIILYGYSTAHCSYTVSSNKLTLFASGLNYRIVMIVGLKFGVTPTETRSLSLSKSEISEGKKKVDETPVNKEEK